MNNSCCSGGDYKDAIVINAGVQTQKVLVAMVWGICSNVQ